MKRGLAALGHLYNFTVDLKIKAVKAACTFAVPNIPHKEDYLPFYSPWEGKEFQKEYGKVRDLTLVKPQRCYTLLKLLRSTFGIEGEIWECRTYRGGTARLISDSATQSGVTKKIRLFDTFGGMPETDSDKDLVDAGDFRDTSEDSVRNFVGNTQQVVLHPGWVPDTFIGLENSTISFAHVDLDIYQGVKSALEFIYPRLSAGGIIVFDDYGFPTCPGAKAAVDEILGDRAMCLSDGQAMFINNPPFTA